MDQKKSAKIKLGSGVLGTPPKKLRRFGEIDVVYKKGNPKITNRLVLKGSLYAYAIFNHYWDPGKMYFIEEAKVLYLDRYNKVIALMPLARRTMKERFMDPRLILAGALKVKASSIILAHNDPSEQLNSSAEILELTYKLSYAAKRLNIELLDHLLIVPEGYVSVEMFQFEYKKNLGRTVEFTPEKLNSIPEIDLVYKKKADHEIDSRPRIKNANDVYELYKRYSNRHKKNTQEKFELFFLNEVGRVLEMLPITQGDITLITNHRFIIERALKLATTNILIAHVLPSEKLEPTKELTDAICQLKRVISDFNILFHDYVMINTTGYFSFFEKKLL